MSVLPLATVIVLASVGVVLVELLSKMVIAALPVTSIVELAVPKVVFHTPMASVPAFSSVDFQVLLPA